jgi:hypothetical protein
MRPNPTRRAGATSASDCLTCPPPYRFKDGAPRACSHLLDHRPTPYRIHYTVRDSVPLFVKRIGLPRTLALHGPRPLCASFAKRFGASLSGAPTPPNPRRAGRRAGLHRFLRAARPAAAAALLRRERHELRALHAGAVAGEGAGAREHGRASRGRCSRSDATLCISFAALHTKYTWWGESVTSPPAPRWGRCRRMRRCSPGPGACCGGCRTAAEVGSHYMYSSGNINSLGWTLSSYRGWSNDLDYFLGVFRHRGRLHGQYGRKHTEA